MSMLIKTYENQIKDITRNDNNKSIYLVGSAKNMDLYDENIAINDIDIFVISNQKENQIRDIKKIEGIEFDINYFSKEYVNYLIENKIYFFISEMKDAKIIYDKDSDGEKIIKRCSDVYKEGPNNKEESYINKIHIYDNMLRLKDKHEFEKWEYEFLTNLYLKDIISEYFTIKNKWIPKDKKLFKFLREEEPEIFDLVISVYEDYDYNRLEIVYRYVFSQLDKNKLE